LTNLISLALDNTQLSGNIPENIRSLVKLTDMDISDCRFEGLPALNTLTVLNNLKIFRNKFFRVVLSSLWRKGRQNRRKRSLLPQILCNFLGKRNQYLLPSGFDFIAIDLYIVRSCYKI